MRDRLWVIVLAGGEGRRLRGLALDARGEPAPKQFCGFGRDRTLFDATLARAQGLASRDRILVSVTESDRRWWGPTLAKRPRGTVVSQPVRRGTAAGVLLPLLEILHRDPGARVLLMPSDHVIDDEFVLRRVLERAALAARDRPGRVMVLGHTPDRADAEFGWILPSGDFDGFSSGVAAFVEKPGAELAARLMAAGGLWSMFFVAATGVALLGLYQRYLPELVVPLLGSRRRLTGAPGSPSLDAVYERLPTRDVSRDLFPAAISHLRVTVAPPCGWTDLGTPERLARWRRTDRDALAPR